MVVAVAELLVDGEPVWRSLGRELQAESFRYYMQDSTHTNRVAHAADFTLPLVVSKNADNPSLPAVIN